MSMRNLITIWLRTDKALGFRTSENEVKNNVRGDLGSFRVQKLTIDDIALLIDTPLFKTDHHP